jgi:hypothetical protein
VSPVPRVSPEKRGNVWGAVYAAAFMAFIKSEPGLTSPEAVLEKGPSMAADASECADFAVWALKQADEGEEASNG